MEPAVPSAVPYKEMRQGNEPCEALRQRIPQPHPAGTQTVRGRCICQHEAERGQGEWYGQHTRTLDIRRQAGQAKHAERLEQNGNGAGHSGSTIPGHGPQTLPAEREDLTHSGTVVEHGKPVSLLSEVGMPQGRPMEVRVEEEGESEGRPVMGRILGATFPDAKAGRLPSGFLLRESLANRHRRQSR